MTHSMVTAVAGLAVLMFAAPLVPGIATRTKAVFAGRRGAPVWQLYADLWKLWRRGAVYSATTTWMFRLAGPVLVSTLLAAASLLPLDGRGAMFRFPGDAIAFAYLLALGRLVLVLAALDTGSSFEGMGASREVAFASLSELGLFVAFAALGIMTHSLSLSEMLGAGAAGGGTSDTAAAGGVSTLLSLSLFALALVECSRVPVDDPATHLELTMVHEVMVLDHSGPDLAMILYASALKLAVFGGIIVAVLVPGAPESGWSGVGFLLGGMLAVGVAVGIVESVMARMRLPKVPLYIAATASLALFGLILQLG